MDDYLLLSELVDSDDDIDLDLEMVLGDFHHTVQGTKEVLEVVESNLGEDCNIPEKPVQPSKKPSKKAEPPKEHDDNLFCSIAPLYTENEFLQLFRVKHSVAENLIRGFKTDNQSKLGSEIHLVLPEVQILSTLWFLGQETATFQDVTSYFGLGSDQFGRILQRVIAFLSKGKNKKIHLPDEKKKRLSKKHFAKNHGFQGAIGCIGTLRIKFNYHEKDAGPDILKYKGNIVVLQAVVNEESKFADLYICENASTSVEILLSSPLYEALPTACKGGEYLLGGAAYPCLRYLLTPYADEDNLTGGHIYFNLRLANCLQTTDTAFSLLTQRFRKLLNLELPSFLKATQIMTACCIVHNLADNEDFENVYEPPISNNIVDDDFVKNSQELHLQNTPVFLEGPMDRDRVCKELLQE